MAKPDGGMFGIKLIGPKHLQFPVFTHEFDGRDGRQTLMNFKGDAAHRAADIPTGHRCLVYVTKQWKRFIWAIQVAGSLEDGDAAMTAHGFQPRAAVPGVDSEWTLHRPIRFLARVDSPQRPAGPRDIQGPTAHEVSVGSGVALNRLRPFAPGHRHITANEYQQAFNAIGWTWTATVEPSVIQPAPAFIEPPVPNPDQLLTRIRDVYGLPERNNEDVVKLFLTQLGHNEGYIVFQTGRVDVRLNAPDGEALAVVEVKRSLADRKNQEQARDQGFRYAMKVSARFVVLTDADIYEVYDLTKDGLGYESKFSGRFQLTAFRPADESVLNLLRPSNTTG